MRSRFVHWLPALLSACTIADSVPPPAAADSSAAALIDTKIPAAVAGDTGWRYVQRAKVDLDDDGAPEMVVVLSDVTIGDSGEPLWEDGHRWQVYVENSAGERTRVYSRFLPNGALNVRFTEAGPGAPSRMLLLERMPFALDVYDVRYAGAGRLVLHERMERRLSMDHRFEGSPEP